MLSLTKTKNRESLNQLFLEYPTPFFIFDLEKVQQQYKRLQSHLEQFEIYYAVKCNPEKALLKHLKKQGSKFEVASFNEFEILKKLGVKSSAVIYSNPVKPPDHIAKAFKAGVNRFAYDSAIEANKLAQYAPGSRVYLRVMVNDSKSQFPLSRKFGAEPKDAAGLMWYAKSLGLEPYGLTFHVGSQSGDIHAWESAIQICGRLMGELKNVHGIELKMLDIGGGFPVPYGSLHRRENDLDQICKVVQDSIRKHIPYKVDLAVEPGRILVAEAGTLVSSVIGKEIRSGEDWLYLDAGLFSGLMEVVESRYGLDYPVTSSLDDVVEEETFTIAGPTCDSFDTVFYNVPLEKNIGLGDRIFIGSVGAYSLSYASSFNGFPPPKAYFVE